MRAVTIYAFSIENFKRSKYEVDALMEMAKVKLSQLAQHGDLLDRYGASIRVLGQRELVKPDVLEAIDYAVKMTKANTKAILNVCFPYTSHDEITTAIRDTVIDYSTPSPSLPRPFSESHIAHTIRARHLTAATARLRAPSQSSNGTSDTEDSTSATTPQLESPPAEPAVSPDSKASGETLEHQSTPLTSLSSSISISKPQGTYPDPENITAEILNDHMFTAGLPALDLLIRTSGVERLSDFMLWQCHQETQIVFLKCLWPEFDLWNFLPVLVEWQWRRKKSDERAMAGEKERLGKAR